MIVSVHIRKSGGSSFRQELKDYYGDKLLLDYGDEIGSSVLSSKYKRLKSKVMLFQNRQIISKQYDIVHGHFFADKYDLLDINLQLVTFLRNPIQRVLSNYYYLKRNPYRKHPDAEPIHRKKLSLEEYIMHKDARNLQAQFLNGKKLSDFTFIGITERYEESIKLFNRVFSTNLKSQYMENVNPKKDKEYDITPDLLKLIITYNELDYELYQNAINIFENDLKKYNLYFEE